MRTWVRNLLSLMDAGRNSVLISVVHSEGSVPREAGTKMIVTADGYFDTIGGGNLEYIAIKTARELIEINEKSNPGFVELYPLGPMLEQCCGGVVFLHYEYIAAENQYWCAILKTLMESHSPLIIVSHRGDREAGCTQAVPMLVSEFECKGTLDDLSQRAVETARSILREEEESSSTRLQSLKSKKGKLPDISEVLIYDHVRPCDFHLAVYGAGHVGAAIVDILPGALDCEITWVDSRAEQFPEELPAEVSKCLAAMPTSTVPVMPANSFYLVLTHSHELDQALCEAILCRDDIRFLGLIGSETKRRRFIKRFRDKGISEEKISRLCCPIGIDNIDSKRPAAIAVSVVAQLLQLRERDSAALNKPSATAKVVRI